MRQQDFLNRLLEEGVVYKEVDGYYYFLPREGDGCYSAHDLRLIADFIDSLNQGWHQSVVDNLSQSE